MLYMCLYLTERLSNAYIEKLPFCKTAGFFSRFSLSVLKITKQMYPNG